MGWKLGSRANPSSSPTTRTAASTTRGSKAPPDCGRQRQDRLGLRQLERRRAPSAQPQASATARIRLPRGIASPARPAGQPPPTSARACAGRGSSPPGRRRDAASAAAFGPVDGPQLGRAGELAALGRGAARARRRSPRRRAASPRRGRAGPPSSAAAIRSSAAWARGSPGPAERARARRRVDEHRRDDADDEHPEHRRAEVRELVADQGRRAVPLVVGREGEAGEAEVDRPHRDAARVQGRRHRGPRGRAGELEQLGADEHRERVAADVGDEARAEPLLGAEHEAGDQVGDQPDDERRHRARDVQRDQGDHQVGAEEDAVARP